MAALSEPNYPQLFLTHYALHCTELLLQVEAMLLEAKSEGVDGEGSRQQQRGGKDEEQREKQGTEVSMVASARTQPFYAVPCTLSLSGRAVCLSVCLSVCPSIYLSACLSACLPACLPVCLSVSLSIYLSACLLMMYFVTTRLQQLNLPLTSSAFVF